MQQARLKRLLAEYFNNSISSADCEELLTYLSSADPAMLDELIDIEFAALDEGPRFTGKQSQDVLNRIKTDPRFGQPIYDEQTNRPKIIKFYQRRMVRIAAAILVFFIAGLAVFNNRKAKTDNQIATNNKPAVIVPGSNKAILTVSGGKTIVLDAAANGLVAKTGAGEVLKTQQGQLVYKDSGAKALAAVEYNTLTTPRGGEYQLVLPDGTKVWLDAASSITYPVAFTGNSRRVKLTGQGYFEVAKNKEKPFYVDVNQTEIKVLGTHFNISAYDDDGKNTTTLLEGSVQVTKNNKIAMLKPGQQAVIVKGSDNIAVSEADIEDAMAWKNGYFIFNDDDIRGIMRKVSRWYDVDVDFQRDFSDQHFGGTFYRSKSINELLDHFQKIGNMHFKISGRRIIVMD
jgi:transmembrane sensor